MGILAGKRRDSSDDAPNVENDDADTPDYAFLARCKNGDAGEGSINT